MSLFGVTFANPLLWFGIFAVGGPLLIHLLTRRTPITLTFPTVRFLKSATADQSSLHRLRHLLLLILRTLIVLLVLLAFLKPILQKGSLALGGDRHARHASILIIDTSLSMSYSGSSLTPLSRAKAAAERVLDLLDDQDLANVVLASAAPLSSLESPKPNRYQLKRDIQNAEATLDFANIDAAIGEAVEQLEGLDGYRKEIHFVSDFQRTGWSSVRFETIPESIETVFVSVAEKDASNVAITEARVEPAAPVVFEKVELVCKVSNFGREPKTVPVRFEWEGSEVDRKEVRLNPGMTESVSFPFRPRSSGRFEGAVGIPADGLMADNRRFFSLTVSDRLEVILLSDRDPSQDLAGRAFLTALNPFPGDRGALDPRWVVPDDFDRFVASEAQGVLVSNVDRFSRQTAQSLVDYLREGGGVVYFLSAEADKFNLSLLAEVSQGDLELPFRPTELHQPRTAAKSSYTLLQDANYDHPMLRKFRETGALAEIRFYRYFQTDREQTRGQVLLRYDDGNIALSEKTAGIGTLLLANYSPNPDASDLAKRTVFVPLVHEMFRGVRPRSFRSATFTVGGSCSGTVLLPSESTQPRFTSPSGEEVNAGLEMNGLEAAVLIGRTREAGFYRIESNATTLGSIPVNVDSRESNLEPLSIEQLGELNRVSRDQVLAGSGNDLEALRRLREGLPLWYYFLLSGLGFLFLEQILSLVWRR